MTEQQRFQGLPITLFHHLGSLRVITVSQRISGPYIGACWNDWEEAIRDVCERAINEYMDG